MSHKTTTILIPPALSNSSCSHPRYATSGPPITWGSVTEATFVLLLTVGICGANILVIIVINTRRYSKYIHSQPRYLLTCLASNDLAVGLLVTSVAFLPALLTCWPYSEIICQIQALLRGALTQQSAMILIYMAVDRYTCMLHPVKYHKHASKK
ncbi:neuropeptide FF receptor 2, partial [Diaphorina citri]|uniref:Neuropeptide FF receptor 2 n=1 Tax=Diaphorina citri TaxID=121845 RepID=A0A1S4ET98_DIACI